MADEDQTQNDNQQGQEPDNQQTTTSAEDAKTDNGSQGQAGNSVPYERFQQVIEEKNEYKNELEQLKDKLEEMDDPEEVKDEYETKLEKMENKSVNREKEFALKEAALTEGVNKKALDDFAQVANLDDLEVTDDGEVKGVEDLIETMKEEKSYFFSEEDEGETSSSAGDQFSEPGENQDTDEALREAMGL